MSRIILGTGDVKNNIASVTRYTRTYKPIDENLNTSRREIMYSDRYQRHFILSKYKKQSNAILMATKLWKMWINNSFRMRNTYVCFTPLSLEKIN